MLNSSNLEDNLFNFFIYSDCGDLIYKISNDQNFDESIQRILQALYFTALDLKSEVNILTTDYGLLSYKSFHYKNISLLLALVIPNYFGDEELAELITERVLDYLYDVLVIHIGLIDLYSFESQGHIEKLKKLIENYENSLRHILISFKNLNFLLKSEKKFEINKELLYPIRHYLENFKNMTKIDFLCLTINSSVVWASTDWLSLDISDRLLFIMISYLYSDGDINVIPIYFSKTILENEATGKIPYKLFSLNLFQNNNMNCKLTLMTDSACTMEHISNSISSSIFDEYFLSRLIKFKNVTSIGNIIDNIAKSVIIFNNVLKTYKIMIDENCEGIFSNFFQNTHYSSTLFKKISEYDEFYVKDQLHLFYFYKIGDLTFFILYNKETTFDDVNTVKVTLKTLKENFDNNENYN